MITPMTKVTILIFHRVKDDFLIALQQLGLLHISQEERETSDELLKDMGMRIERTQLFFKAAEKVKNNDGAGKKSLQLKAAFDYVQLYEETKNQLSDIGNRLEKLERELRNVAPWGDFDVKALKDLAAVGINVRFYIAPVKKFNSCVSDDICYQEISRDKTYVYFVVFEKGESVQIDCDQFFYPETDKKQLEDQFVHIQEEKNEKEQLLRQLFTDTSRVQDYMHSLQTEFAFLTVSNNLPSAAEQTVYIINGWLPLRLKANVAAFLESEKVFYDFSKPQDGEDVPVLLTNNRFARLFEPITKLFSLPAYAELDLTAFFAPFFTLFFGFCLGDAGYGLIIFIAALIAHMKLSSDKKAVAALVMVLGMSTFIFGLISGTFFGIELINIRLLRKVVLFKQDQLFNVALLLGVIQVLFGMVLKAVNRIRQNGIMASLSTFGWVIMICGILGLSISRASMGAVFVGIGLILLFNDLKANIFVRIGKGLWELYGITGVVGDVLSYLRLFALGVSSAILGLVINDIAMQLKGIPYIGFVLTFVFLVIFHALNLFLSALSSFVHPLRLTFVEFFKSADYRGGGKAYNPFRQIK